jgi:hypothetical protein
MSLPSLIEVAACAAEGKQKFESLHVPVGNTTIPDQSNKSQHKETILIFCKEKNNNISNYKKICLEVLFALFSIDCRDAVFCFSSSMFDKQRQRLLYYTYNVPNKCYYRYQLVKCDYPNSENKVVYCFREDDGCCHFEHHVSKAENDSAFTAVIDRVKIDKAIACQINNTGTVTEKYWQ